VASAKFPDCHTKEAHGTPEHSGQCGGIALSFAMTQVASVSIRPESFGVDPKMMWHLRTLTVSHRRIKTFERGRF